MPDGAQGGAAKRKQPAVASARDALSDGWHGMRSMLADSSNNSKVVLLYRSFLAQGC